MLNVLLETPRKKKGGGGEEYDTRHNYRPIAHDCPDESTNQKHRRVTWQNLQSRQSPHPHPPAVPHGPQLVAWPPSLPLAVEQLPRKTHGRVSMGTLWQLLIGIALLHQEIHDTIEYKWGIKRDSLERNKRMR
jgi:hypothetical protein